MKSILITGASGGLGHALSQCFSRDRVRIGVHVYQNRAKGKELVRALNVAGCEAFLFSADLRDVMAVREMFQTLEEKWGGLDLLVNNAAARDDRLFQGIDSSDWDHLVGLNLSGAFYCMREAGRLMLQQKKGHIINIASHGAFTGRIGQAAYTASKRGLIGLSQEAAKEWGADSIQVNTVCPGFLPTPMTATLRTKHKRKMIAENLLNRTSTLEEVSAFIRHLSQMQHVSAQVFHLDSRPG